MKKTTKILLVLAAVVAMTIGAMSTVMAAEEYRVIDPATWSLQDDDTWQAKDTNGVELKNCWATDPEGKWYYFEDKAILQEAFLKWRGDYYYFDKDGYMCTGWVEFDEDDAEDLEDLEDFLSVSAVIEDSLFDEDTAYETVWCYFGRDGIAVVDDWANDYGLWYYFDGMVMVCDDFDYVIEDEIYGFSGDGNMHVGWVEVAQKKAKHKDTPIAGADTAGTSWVYYNTEGDMVEAGWNKIDGVWYYFVANPEVVYEADEEGKPVNVTNTRFNVVLDEDTPVMIHTAYVQLDGGNYFYFNGDGAMQTGAVTFGKEQKLYTNIKDFFLKKLDNVKTTKATADVFFGSDGAQKFKDKGASKNQWYVEAGKVGNIYLESCAEVVTGSAINLILTEKFGDLKVGKVNGKDVNEYVDNGYKSDIEGSMLKNAFRTDGKKVYYYDEDGNMVKSDVVDIKVDDVILTLAFNKDGLLQGIIDDVEPGDKMKLNGRYYYFHDEVFGTFEIGDYTYMACGTKKPDIED